MVVSKLLRAIVLLSVLVPLCGAFLPMMGGSGSSTTEVPPAFARLTGLQTNEIELARHVGFASLEPYASDRADLIADATAARDAWAHTLTAGDWESDSGRCEPVGATTAGVDLRNAATDIFALAMAGYMAGSDTYYAAARTRILQFTALTDFDFATETLFDGANQCTLDLGSAVSNVLEAAWLLEDVGYASWTLSDRVAVADWLVGEVIPVLSWAPSRRKNNWGAVALKSLVASIVYVDGYASSITIIDHLKNPSTTTPAAYLEFIRLTVLPRWLSASGGDELDSTCAAGGRNFGVQASGGFPDELRRTAPSPDNCDQTSMAFACPGDVCPQNSGAQFYQLKALNALAWTCEAFRRIDGGGAACFDLTSHGGLNTLIEDGLLFATGGDYQTLGIQATTQGVKYLAGEYFEDGCILDAADAGAPVVLGGRDVAYTKVTHAPGVANTTDATPCPGDPPAPGSFVTVAQAVAAGSTEYGSIVWPTMYTNVPYAPRTWDTVNVTSPLELGTASIGCTELTPDDGLDDAANLHCMLNDPQSEGVCLLFPDGQYEIDPSGFVGADALFRPDFAHSRRCMRSQNAHGAVLNLGGVTYPMHGGGLSPVSANRNFFALLDGEDAVNPTTTKTWTAGYTKGTTVVTVGDTTGLSAVDGASGNWILLESTEFAPGDQGTARDLNQPGSCCYYATRITAIDGNQLTLAHPLPKDFPVATMGGQINAFDPGDGWALLDLEVQFDPAIKDHQSGSWQFVIGKNMTRLVIDGVRFRSAYRQFMTIQGQVTPTRRAACADIHVIHSDFLDPRWDKGANGYGVLINLCDRVVFHDNYGSHSTLLAMQYDTDEALISFNTCVAMAPETRTDTTPHDGCEDGSGGLVAVADQLCDESYLGDPSAGNDCRVCQTAHSSEHGVTVTTPGGAAYSHCNTNPSSWDALGGNGETSCVGAPSGKIYSCIEWHNKAASNSVIARNYLDGGIWFGNNSGFDGIRVHGNWVRGRTISGAPAFNTAGADPGTLATWRNENSGDPGLSILPNNWSHDTQFTANVADSGLGGAFNYPGIFGQTGSAFDQYGDGVGAYDNVIEDSCVSSDSGNPTAGACATSSGGDYRAGVNTSWAHNTVGDDQHASPRVVPTVPGTTWTSWVDVPFVGTPSSGSAPWGVGSDVVGDPDARDPCLPSRARNEGC